MKKYFIPFLAVIFFVSCLSFVACKKTEEQKLTEGGQPVDKKYTWDLTEIYKDVDAWKTAQQKFQKKLPELSKYQGRLGESADTLASALNLMFDLKKEAWRLEAYAMFLNDLDKRVATNEALKQEADTLDKKFNETSAFVMPEILSLDKAVVDGFVTSNPKLKVYQFYLDNILRLKPHTRSPEVEKILAQVGQALNASENTYDTFTDAEMPFPEIQLSTGEKVKLDKSAYVKHRQNPNLEDRHLVFQVFWSTHEKFKATFGSLLYGEVMSHVFNKDVRGYKTSLEAALDGDGIPASVYEQLIIDVRTNLPVLHRYLKLRKHMMGLKELKYEDLYVPLVKELDQKYTVDQAQELVLKAASPLGEASVAMIKKAFESRWVDFYPSTGKRSGAYSESAVYDVHPYQLMNFTDSYDSVATLAHEMGHGLHAYFTNKNQPFVYANYATFVAEVASTINEALLFRSMLPQTKSDDERLSLLGARLEGYRQTLFRQTMFADFELKLHQMAEKGEPITGDSVTKMYLNMLREYYGHDQKICTIDDLYGVEWAYIPHFYRNFYVFTYATSLTASTDISRRIYEDETAAAPTHKPRDLYLKMLSAGGSDDPIDLLKGAGVDMTTSAPFAAAMKEMNEIMDEMEKILEKKGK